MLNSASQKVQPSSLDCHGAIKERCVVSLNQPHLSSVLTLTLNAASTHSECAQMFLMLSQGLDYAIGLKGQKQFHQWEGKLRKN